MGESVPRERWENLDWNREPKEIAAEIDVSITLVYCMAKELKKTMKRGKNGPVPVYDWDSVDLEKMTQAQISKQLGCSRERARQKKQEWKKNNDRSQDKP